MGFKSKYLGIKFGLFYVPSCLSLLVSSLFVIVLHLGSWDYSIRYIFVYELFGINRAYDVSEMTNKKRKKCFLQNCSFIHVLDLIKRKIMHLINYYFYLKFLWLFKM